MRRLLTTDKPKSDESFLGYIVRLTQLNHCTKPSWILHAASGRRDDLFTPPFVSSSYPNLLSLAQLCGVSEENLYRLLYIPVTPTTEKLRKSTYWVFNSSVPRCFIRAYYSKVCTLCLRETGYIRKIWDLSPVTACTIHKCLLIGECPGCGSLITSLRNNVGVCVCGFDWRLTVPTTVQDSDLIVTRQIQWLCSVAASRSVYGPLGRGNPLTKLNFASLMRLLSLIARCQKEALDKKSRTHLTTRTVFEVHGLLNKAIDIFNDWPERYYSFLGWCRSLNQKTKSGGGVIKDFGIFHHGINYQLTSPDFDFMRTSFQEYLITSWDGGYVRPIASCT